MSMRKMGAIGIAVLAALSIMNVPAYAEDLVQPSDTEIEQMVLELEGRYAALASSRHTEADLQSPEYEEFKSFWKTELDEETMKSSFNSDYKNWTQKDQHFATVLVSEFPEYFVEVTSAITDGYSTSWNNQFFTYVYTEDGLKYETDEKIISELNDIEKLPVPQGLLDAYHDDRNYFLLTGDNEQACADFWYVNPNNYIDGAFVYKEQWCWIDEAGNLEVAVTVSNGIGETRSIEFTDFRLVCDEIGTIYDGPTQPNTQIVIKAKSSDLYIFTIPADQISYATERWEGGYSWYLGKE